MATPSSRNNPGATPTQVNSSPHPSASLPMARPLSHKSPSHRTPSFSGHGTSAHPPGTASHQYSTPLAAMASMEDNIAFSSPSALLALGGLGGITPSPAGNHIHDNVINSIGMSGLGISGARDSDKERKKNIDEAIQLLETRVTGRGICREGVERLGKLEGFECMWDENKLSIAGLSVDLEIEFDAGAETVKDVSLRYVTPDALEGERREEATAVLRRDLVQPLEDKRRGRWKKMHNFHANLKRLARLDKLSHGINCFEAVEGMYESLKRVWEEEKTLPALAGDWEHLCSGAIGRPVLHSGDRVGLGLEYWVEKRRMLELRPENRAADRQARDDDHVTWSVAIGCEEGHPSIRVSKDWVAPEAIERDAQPGDKSSVNWTDPPPARIRSNPDSMDHDSGNQSPATPNCRFVAKLQPSVNIPILVASEIYRLLEMELPQDFKMNTYDGLLFPAETPPESDGQPDSQPVTFEEQQSSHERFRVKSVVSMNEDGPETRPYRFTFHALDHVAGCTIQELPFSHPKQLAEILPILRQYSLLSTLIRDLFIEEPESDSIEFESGSSKAAQSSSAAQSSPGRSQPRASGVMLSNNARPGVSMLDTLLTEDYGGDGVLRVTKVDVSLRTPGSGPPSILLLFFPGIGKPAITMNIEIGPNGRIRIPDTSGLWENVAGNAHDRPSAEEVEQLYRLFAQSLEILEDLGVFIQSMLRWVKKKKKGRREKMLQNGHGNGHGNGATHSS